jgi:hypothetical protein
VGSVPAAEPIPSVGFGHFGAQWDVSSDGERVDYLNRVHDRLAAATLSAWGHRIIV